VNRDKDSRYSLKLAVIEEASASLMDLFGIGRSRAKRER